MTASEAWNRLREAFAAGSRCVVVHADETDGPTLESLGCVRDAAGVYVWRRPGVSAGDVLEVLDVLAGVRVWLDGGWGVDALLGEQTRAHQDLDLAVDATCLDEIARRLAALGYEEVAEGWIGRPTRVVFRDARGRVLDLHPVSIDADGNGWQELPDGGRGLYSRDGLRGEGVVAGRRVPCLTVEQQLAHHRGYELSDTDREDVAKLAVRFAATA